MKKTLLIAAFILLPSAAMAYTSPGKPQGFVSDFAKVMTVAGRQSLEAKLSAFEKSTGIEIAAVTVPSLGDETVDTYAVKLFEEWAIGNKDKDNGLLILVAPAEHKARIEVGYGLEGVVTDLQSSNILTQVMFPAFRNGDYDAGISGAADAVIGIITDAPDAAQYSSAPRGGDDTQARNLGVFVFFGFMLLSVLGRVLGRTKSWWLGGVLGGVIGVIVGFIWGFVYWGIGAIVVLSVLGLAFDFIVSKFGGGNGRGGPGIWFLPGGLGGGRGFGGGGFGGFGGGSSGGGGASGGW